MRTFSGFRVFTLFSAARLAANLQVFHGTYSQQLPPINSDWHTALVHRSGLISSSIRSNALNFWCQQPNFQGACPADHRDQLRRVENVPGRSGSSDRSRESFRERVGWPQTSIHRRADECRSKGIRASGKRIHAEGRSPAARAGGGNIVVADHRSPVYRYHPALFPDTSLIFSSVCARGTHFSFPFSSLTFRPH